MLPNSNQSIDTIPAVVYSTLRRTSKTQTNQFYNFLLARLATDTVALIKK
jgi:hypothetical protein